MTRVLAIDPGYGRLGIAVLEGTRGSARILHSDCLTTTATETFADRLFTLGTTVENLISRFKPTVLALERVYFKNNQKTAMHVAEVRGMLLYLAALRELSIVEYTPLQVKSAVAADGRASKEGVGRMVKALVKLPAGLRHDDEFDAIAIGLTCLASSEKISKS